MTEHAIDMTGEPPLTLAKWGDMSEDEPGEFVDGVLVEEEEVGALHEVIGAWLCWVLKAWFGDRKGIVLTSDARFGTSPRRGRKADVSVYFPGRRPPAHGLVTLPPDIMVEIVSPRPRDARRDRVEKMREYAAFGVRYYWIVEPAVRIFEINELTAEGRYNRVLTAAEGKLTEIPGCEGLTLDLDALWAELDQLEAPQQEP